MNYQDQAVIEEMLTLSKRIAVVGLSDNPERSSYGVTEAISGQYEIIPVNPNLETWQGRESYPSLMAIPDEVEVDLVNIFRRSEAVGPIVNECIARGVKYIWMQVGVVNQEAAHRAMESGIKVVMDACIAVAVRSRG